MQLTRTAELRADLVVTIMIMPRITSLVFLGLIAVTTGSSLSCFKEIPSSSTVKNMCERQFHSFPAVPNATSCADQCVADAACVMFAWSNASQPHCRLSTTCKEPTNALPGFDGYYRVSTTGECTPQPSPPSGLGNWTRVFLNEAASNGAVCIDGSPG